MQTIAVLGVGAMGTAIVQGLENSGWGKLDLRLADTDGQRVTELVGDGYLAWTDPTLAAESARVVVLAVKPDVVADVLAAIAPVVGPGHVVVSIAAGVRLDRLEAALPGVPAVRAMPNTPALVGRAMTAYAAGVNVTDTDVADATAVLGAVGEVVAVAEADLDAVTAVSGSGPAYVFLLTEALAEAARSVGLAPEVAEQLARRTVIGAGALLEADAASPEELRRRVTSPNGTTEAAIHALELGGARRLIREAVEAATRRSVELGSVDPTPESAPLPDTSS